jgi:predicted nuclease of predicted toxin-antitoxin system
MNLLLDECTPWRLKREFTGHAAFTVEDAGLKGLKNGRLLQAASGRFDVLVTVDKSVPSQQNLSSLNIALLILRARTNRFQDLKPLIPQSLTALDTISPGDIVVIQ